MDAVQTRAMAELLGRLAPPLYETLPESAVPMTQKRVRCHLSTTSTFVSDCPGNRDLDGVCVRRQRWQKKTSSSVSSSSGTNALLKVIYCHPGDDAVEQYADKVALFSITCSNLC